MRDWKLACVGRTHVESESVSPENRLERLYYGNQCGSFSWSGLVPWRLSGLSLSRSSRSMPGWRIRSSGPSRRFCISWGFSGFRFLSTQVEKPGLIIAGGPTVPIPSTYTKPSNTSTSVRCFLVTSTENRVPRTVITAVGVPIRNDGVLPRRFSILLTTLPINNSRENPLS